MAKTKKARAGDKTFEVFGRDHAERPLQHLGTVRAENKQLAIAHALPPFIRKPVQSSGSHPNLTVM